MATTPKTQPKPTRNVSPRKAHLVFKRHPEQASAFAEVAVFGDARKALAALGGELRGYEYAEVDFGQPLTTALAP